MYLNCCVCGNIFETKNEKGATEGENSICWYFTLIHGQEYWNSLKFLKNKFSRVISWPSADHLSGYAVSWAEETEKLPARILSLTPICQNRWVDIIIILLTQSTLARPSELIFMKVVSPWGDIQEWIVTVNAWRETATDFAMSIQYHQKKVRDIGRLERDLNDGVFLAVKSRTNL